MKQFIFLLLAGFISTLAYAEEFSERVKITGLRCDYGKAGIHLRSLETDRILYLAKNIEGVPQYLEMLENHCKGITKNLNQKLSGQVLDVDFHTETFTKRESVYVPPRNPCRPGRTKCDDGYYVEKDFDFLRTETVIDDYRFFNELKIGEHQ